MQSFNILHKKHLHTFKGLLVVEAKYPVGNFKFDFILMRNFRKLVLLIEKLKKTN